MRKLRTAAKTIAMINRAFDHVCTVSAGKPNMVPSWLLESGIFLVLGFAPSCFGDR
jgi:hypothetical protein